MSLKIGDLWIPPTKASDTQMFPFDDVIMQGPYQDQKTKSHFKGPTSSISKHTSNIIYIYIYIWLKCGNLSLISSKHLARRPILLNWTISKFCKKIGKVYIFAAATYKAKHKIFDTQTLTYQQAFGKNINFSWPMFNVKTFLRNKSAVGIHIFILKWHHPYLTPPHLEGNKTCSCAFSFCQKNKLPHSPGID